ncbi:MAG: hypothetical protein FWF91_05845, partial [Coriobacteriia bacterium]|nr:hypothetical protein [Coriobacteriia bacterium]
MRLISKKTPMVFAMVTVLMAGMLVVLAGCSNDTNSNKNADAKTEINSPYQLAYVGSTGSNPMNNAGLTYGYETGTPDGYSPEYKIPDLIYVLPSKGRVPDEEGAFIYKTDIGLLPSDASPEEVARWTEERNANEARRFTEIAFALLGMDNRLNDEEAQAAYEAAKRFTRPYSSPESGEWVYSEEDAQGLADALGIDLSILPQKDALRIFCFRVFSTIQNDYAIEVPMYEYDGVTQVGIYAVPG